MYRKFKHLEQSRFDEQVLFWMRTALTLAKKGWGRTKPNPMVGAVIVKDGVLLGRGYHRQAGGPHAEINALKDASDSVEGADLYVTLEPCSTFGRTPPCTAAIIEAKIKRVWIGCVDPNPQHAGKGIEILRAAGIEVVSGVEEVECRELNEHFFHWIVTGRPFVLLKLAMTLDGKIATAEGDSKWVTGEIARSRVQRLRQWADAVLIGGETVRKDHPQLNVREPSNWWRQPRRLIATQSMGDLELEIIFSGDPQPETISARTRQQWLSVLERLGREQVAALLVEGGGVLAGHLLDLDLVDKVEFHIAPKILGGTGRNAIGGSSPMTMAEALHLRNVHWQRLGEDFSITGYPEHGTSLG